MIPIHLFLELVVIPLFAAVGLSILFSILSTLADPKDITLRRWVASFGITLLFSMPLNLLGYVSGYLAGISRAPVVGNLIPAGLTLVGAITIYIFQSDFTHRAVLSYSISLFALFVLYGIEVGAYEREYRQVERYEILSKEELQIRKHRINAGLPADPPSWITGLQDAK